MTTELANNPAAGETPVPMTPEILRALAGLHDLQVIEWPVAGGAALARSLPLPQVVAGVALALIFCAGWLVWRRTPQQRRRRRLAALEARWRSGAAAPECAAALATLLREAAGQRRRDLMPAGLAGDAWLSWLNARSPAADRGAFLTGDGRLLLDLPYRARPAGDGASEVDGTSDRAPDLAPLFLLARRWLRAN